MEQRSISAYVAEFLGTFVLVFAITLVVSLFVNAQGNGSDWAVASLAQGFILFALIASLGAVSGGHFNPAVTLGALVLRKINPVDGAMYVIVQLIGAILGAWMTKFILDDALADQVNVGAATLNKALLGASLQGLVMEALGTFVLVWVVVAMAMNPKAPKDWAPFAIGATLAALVMVAGSLTGAAFNPARWFGPALISGEFGDWWAYLVGDIAGGVLGATAYWYLFVNSGDKPQAPSNAPSS